MKTVHETHIIVEGVLDVDFLDRVLSTAHFEDLIVVDEVLESDILHLVLLVDF